jgi:hypothetical protein
MGVYLQPWLIFSRLAAPSYPSEGRVWVGCRLLSILIQLWHLDAASTLESRSNARFQAGGEELANDIIIGHLWFKISHEKMANITENGVTHLNDKRHHANDYSLTVC